MLLLVQHRLLSRRSLFHAPIPRRIAIVSMDTETGRFRFSFMLCVVETVTGTPEGQRSGRRVARVCALGQTAHTGYGRIKAAKKLIEEMTRCRCRTQTAR